MVNKFQHQKDLNGCGVACLANLLQQDYDLVKKEFEKKFYNIKKGVNVSDLVRFLEIKNLKYKNKFFNQNKKYKLKPLEAQKYSKVFGSITLIFKNEKYPIGHYLLRVKNGWVDPWVNYPSIDNVHAGIIKKLPGDPWYVIYPSD